jgi:hypothetical protein
VAITSESGGGMTQPLARGDAFEFVGLGFGVVLRANPTRGLALVLFAGAPFSCEVPTGSVMAARDWLEQRKDVVQ